MTNQENRWLQVGAAIRKRIEDELGLSYAEFERRSGVSYKTVQGYMDGQPVRRRDKARALCLALYWTADSVDRLQRGESAVDLRSAYERSVAEFANWDQTHQEAMKALDRMTDPAEVAFFQATVADAQLAAEKAAAERGSLLRQLEQANRLASDDGDDDLATQIAAVDRKVDELGQSVGRALRLLHELTDGVEQLLAKPSAPADERAQQ